MVGKTNLAPALMKLSLKLINNIIINVFLIYNTNKQDDVIEKIRGSTDHGDQGRPSY